MPDSHEKLDRFKLLAAKYIVDTVDMATIRAKSVSNLDRWNSNGVWVSAHDEWRVLMVRGSDAEVIAAMTGLDENSNRLRQSAPYTGLITQEKRREILGSVGIVWENAE